MSQDFFGMRVSSNSNKLLSTLVLLTSLFLFAQITFFTANILARSASDTLSVILPALTKSVLYSPVILFPIFKFVLAQLLIYTALIGIIWYLAISLSDLFCLRPLQIRLLGIIIWVISITGILSANCYYFPETFFSQLIRQNLFNNSFTDAQYKIILLCAIILLAAGFLLSLINFFYHLSKRVYKVRDVIALACCLGIFLIVKADDLLATPKYLSAATKRQPNIIIIGFDALRPDFIGVKNKFGVYTPNINNFMSSAIQFTDAYTPLARTLPSWTSLLTSRYPKNNKARGNNTDISEINLQETLAKSLQKQGYETFYATDDRRYNNLNEQFGFDYIIGPPTGFNDFLLGSANDFPLSNLLVSTPIGRLLFPYNYANHDVATSFSPDNFLQLIRQALHKRENKPIFLAVHFNITGYPFYWIGCKEKKEGAMLALYKNGINAADQQFAEFMGILQKNNLLQHAIVILLSDHGLTLGLANDRVIEQSLFQGSKHNLKKIRVAKYAAAPQYSMDYQHDYGIDTSYGYGGDILSLKQNSIVLAWKGYNVNLGKQRIIPERVSVLDITPTILDYLRYPPLQTQDGISLKNLMQTANSSAVLKRDFYFETSFSIPEIETEHVSVDNVLKKVIHLYEINPESGQVFFQHAAEHAMNHEKEHAIMHGEWYLASYPATRVLQLVSTANKSKLLHSQQLAFKSSIIPPYKVLINLRTGQWTTEWTTMLALHAPLQILQDKLQDFYGSE